MYAGNSSYGVIVVLLPVLWLFPAMDGMFRSSTVSAASLTVIFHVLVW